jgi:hypothetical protein
MNLEFAERYFHTYITEADWKRKNGVVAATAGVKMTMKFRRFRNPTVLLILGFRVGHLGVMERLLVYVAMIQLLFCIVILLEFHLLRKGVLGRGMVVFNI